MYKILIKLIFFNVIIDCNSKKYIKKLLKNKQ